MLPPFISHGGDQCSNRNRKEDHDEMALEPVFTLTLVKNNLQGAEAKSDQRDTDVVDLQFAADSCRLGFLYKLWRVGNESLRENQTDQTNGNVNEKYPAPGEMICDPTAQRRPDCGRGHDGHAVKSKCRRALGSGKCVHQDGLLDWGQTASAHALQDAEKDQQAQAGRDATQKTAAHEQCDTGHVIVFAAENTAQPCA